MYIQPQYAALGLAALGGVLSHEKQNARVHDNVARQFKSSSSISGSSSSNTAAATTSGTTASTSKTNGFMSPFGSSSSFATGPGPNIINVGTVNPKPTGGNGGGAARDTNDDQLATLYCFVPRIPGYCGPSNTAISGAASTFSSQAIPTYTSTKTVYLDPFTQKPVSLVTPTVTVTQTPPPVTLTQTQTTTKPVTNFQTVTTTDTDFETVTLSPSPETFTHTATFTDTPKAGAAVAANAGA